jgi:hypothetical protein
VGFVASIPIAWIVFALCVITAAVALIASRRRKMAAADLGAVSDHWIAEYRLGRGDDGGR